MSNTSGLEVTTSKFCVCVYLAVRNPDRLHLLLPDGVFDAAVPGVIGCVQVNGSWTREPLKLSTHTFTDNVKKLSYCSFNVCSLYR